MADNEPREFSPDWAVRPGVFLYRMMTERKIGPATLGLRAGMRISVVRAVLDGSARVDTVIASQLDAALRTGTSFWLDAQAAYDASLAAGAAGADEVHGHA